MASAASMAVAPTLHASWLHAMYRLAQEWLTANLAANTTLFVLSAARQPLLGAHHYYCCFQLLAADGSACCTSIWSILVSLTL